MHEHKPQNVVSHKQDESRIEILRLRATSNSILSCGIDGELATGAVSIRCSLYQVAIRLPCIAVAQIVAAVGTNQLVTVNARVQSYLTENLPTKRTC